MARSQQNVWGEAKALVRELAHDPSPEVVRRINSQFPHHIPRILGQFTLEQQARLGISMTRDHGRLAKLVLTHAAESDHSQAMVPEQRPASPTEVAKALNKARQAPGLTVVKDPPLHVMGYGKPVAPSSVARAWSAASAATDRVGVMRRAVGLREAEVSVISHGGNYDQVHSDEDKSTVERHAGKLLTSLMVSPVEGTRIVWSSRSVDIEPRYSLQHLPLGADDAEQVPALVLAQTFGQAVETGAVLGEYGRDDVRYKSPGRIFTLLGSTAFAIDPVLVGELTDGAEISPDEPFVVGTEAATVVDDFVRAQDLSVLVPAYTNYVMRQQLAAA